MHPMQTGEEKNIGDFSVILVFVAESCGSLISLITFSMEDEKPGNK